MKPFSQLKIALISDNLTRDSLSHECKIANVTPENYGLIFQFWKPDILFVEATWRGFFNRWRFKIATYPDRHRKKNNALERVVTAARKQGIPTVFWNREDGVHFDRFIDSAMLFDAVLTVDEAMLPRYKECLPDGVPVDVMEFSVQPAIHHPTNEPAQHRGSFVGSYSLVHPERKKWQDMTFSAANPLGLDVYDRNSNRRNSQYRFPDYDWIKVMPAVSFAKTADIYRSHMVNLNVNTITGSKSAYSRRLVEIMACGTLAVTNNTLAVQTLFKDLSC